MNIIGRWRRWRRRFDRRAIVLTYHSVSGGPDPLGISVWPENFSDHLKVIVRDFQPTPLRSLVAGRHPRRAVVVTIDDGYRDNLTDALPALERHGVPATIFVTTSAIQTGVEFWWDEVARRVATSPVTPSDLTVSVRGQTHRWPTVTEAERQRAARELVTHMKSLGMDEVDEVMARVREWNATADKHPPSRRPLDVTELKTLAGHPLIEIGSHTHSHTRMIGRDLDVQYRDVDEGRKRLEGWIGHEVTSFAYPFGGRDALSDESVEAVRRSGARIACTLVGEAATPSSDLLRLPRFYVGNWDEATFTRRLRDWSRGSA